MDSKLPSHSVPHKPQSVKLYVRYIYFCDEHKPFVEINISGPNLENSNQTTKSDKRDESFRKCGT